MQNGPNFHQYERKWGTLTDTIASDIEVRVRTVARYKQQDKDRQEIANTLDSIAKKIDDLPGVSRSVTEVLNKKEIEWTERLEKFGPDIEEYD